MRAYKMQRHSKWDAPALAMLLFVRYKVTAFCGVLPTAHSSCRRLETPG